MPEKKLQKFIERMRQAQQDCREAPCLAVTVDRMPSCPFCCHFGKLLNELKKGEMGRQNELDSK